MVATDPRVVSEPLAQQLRAANPWWSNSPGRPIPPYKRWPFSFLKRRLDEPLAPALVLRGPRQVGKTTLQEQLIDDLIKNDHVAPNRILRVQFDELQALRGLVDPILTLSRWFEATVLGTSFNEAATGNTPAFLFFDEVQNLPDWGTQIKALVDTSTVRVVVTGSSALRLQLGKDSLAGRLSSLEMGPLYLREIAGLRNLGMVDPILPFNGPTPLREREFWEKLSSLPPEVQRIRDGAFALFDEWGAYPLAHDHPAARWDEIAQQLRESIIQRAIQHDLRVGDRGRKRDEQLLGEVFRLACRYAGQAPNPQTLAGEIRASLPGDVGMSRVRHYLEFLDSTLLIRLIPPLEIRLKRRKGYPKVCLCDPALRTAYLQERIPLLSAPDETDQVQAALAGHLAESAVGYFLAGVPGLELAWAPARANEPEVDFVVTIGTQRIPIEVKYTRRIEPERDCLGLRTFVEKQINKAPFGLLVTRNDVVPTNLPPTVLPVPLSSLLMLR